MKAKEFVVFNAFALKPFGGNPAAVFPDARDIPEAQLQLIARQLNLIETVFAYPCPRSGVDYQLRYFTPLNELPVAGHPTVATWVALAQRGFIKINNRSIFVQENHAGRQEIAVEATDAGYLVSMVQPSATYTDCFLDYPLIADAIGLRVEELDSTLPIQGVDVGLGHVVVPIKRLEALMRAQMKISRVQEICSSLGMREMQLFSFETHDHANNLFTRNFTPREGLEDPACGNGNGALGAYLAKTKFPNSKVFQINAEQGHGIGMPSLIKIQVSRVERDQLQVVISGSATEMVEGRILV